MDCIKSAIAVILFSATASSAAAQHTEFIDDPVEEVTAEHDGVSIPNPTAAQTEAIRNDADDITNPDDSRGVINNKLSDAGLIIFAFARETGDGGTTQPSIPIDNDGILAWDMEEEPVCHDVRAQSAFKVRINWTFNTTDSTEDSLASIEFGDDANRILGIHIYRTLGSDEPPCTPFSYDRSKEYTMYQKLTFSKPAGRPAAVRRTGVSPHIYYTTTIQPTGSSPVSPPITRGSGGWPVDNPEPSSHFYEPSPWFFDSHNFPPITTKFSREARYAPYHEARILIVATQYGSAKGSISIASDSGGIRPIHVDSGDGSITFP